jgi:hypothetical protein
MRRKGQEGPLGCHQNILLPTPCLPEQINKDLIASKPQPNLRSVMQSQDSDGTTHSSARKQLHTLKTHNS